MTRSTLPLLVLALLIAAAIIAAGCTGSVAAPAAGDIKKFSSADEIREYIRNNTALAAAEGSGYSGTWVGRDAVVAPQAAVAESAVAKGVSISAPSAGATDYSTTNVQVAGVDEPDFVKNDGKYIYVISGQTLAIVDAYPAASASVVSKTGIGDTPRDLFIDRNRLVLFTTGTEDTDVSSSGDGAAPAAQMKEMPYYYRSSLPITHAIFYDITDRANPKVLKDFTIDGDYIDARLIDSNLYLVTREQVYTYDMDRIAVPAMREGTKTVIAPDVYYFDNPERQYAFTMISSFDTAVAKEREAKTYLVGSGNLLYVSENAMYITYQKYHNVYRTMQALPVLAVDDVQGGPVAPSSGIPAPVLWEDFNRMSETEKQALIADMRTREQELLKKEIDQTTTAIHKIAISNGAITYRARGDVPGILESQFSMDEYENNLRVATTSSVSTTRGQYEYNNVFVLDAGMKTIGSLTHIAEQERIYSTRFIGNRLYMVTFKRIDPFFVIDLSSPESPKILGRLKIPGYSDYLHPYDATHIIGVGKETGTNDWGGVSTKGLKLALFDVSDTEHPTQIDKVEIGDAGTDSAALSDHKAFLFDKGKNLLVIPARVVKNEPLVSDKYGISRQNIWYGAYVFGVAPETGFTLRGTVEHGTGNNSYYYYGSSQNEVKRSLYIGDVLYTLSGKQIKANSLSAINTTITTIRLPDGSVDVL
ncbi:MAG: beta-propeller domain-containing protein [Methanoregulaceae archaeon]|nr:beta-propeller domain-containing protein [Methanoregulaceae archaeon]